MLIECRECHGKVSDMAKNCPHCGCPIKVKKVRAEVRQQVASFSEAVAAWYDENKNKKWHEGRMSRSQYFFGWIISTIVCVIIELIAYGLLKLCDCLPSCLALVGLLIAAICAFIIYGTPLGYACICIKATVHRLHDTGYTGWLILAWPIFGPVFFLVMCLWPSQQVENQFGDVPMRT